jgi:hypothetical protein
LARRLLCTLAYRVLGGWKMSMRSNLVIHAAAMNCLSRCTDSDAPLCCLGEFLEKLAHLGWAASDIYEVETRVLRQLGKLRSNRHVGRQCDVAERAAVTMTD